jgi:hypothetical protein
MGLYGKGEAMSVMLRMTKKDVDLGPVLEFLRFEQRLSSFVLELRAQQPKLSRYAFSDLLGILDLNEETISQDRARRVATSAKRALDIFKDKITNEQDKWILNTLAKL